jgi:hypothetical protein
MFTPTQMMLDALDTYFGRPYCGDEEVDSITGVKAAFRDFADFLVHHTPYSPEQVTALRHLAKARSEAVESLAPMKVAKAKLQQQNAQAAMTSR